MTMKPLLSYLFGGFILLLGAFVVWYNDRRDGVRYFAKKTRTKILWTKG